MKVTPKWQSACAIRELTETGYPVKQKNNYVYSASLT